MNTRLQRLTVGCIVVLVGLLLGRAAAEERVALTLAIELAKEGQHAQAGLEFRRAAGEVGGAAEQGGLYWMAAHQYGQAGRAAVADKLLDRAEPLLPEAERPFIRLLRAEAAAEGNSREAAFYYEGLTDSTTPDDLRRYAARQLAIQRLRQKDTAAARKALESASDDEAGGLHAIERYARGRDKRPLRGGLLGVIPGCGYFYAGEYANGIRSIVLNGLFLFGMVHTASEEQWGAFAAITFFEFTWYSGSIYGGLDASHRYNRRRLARAEKDVLGGARFEPEFQRLPLLTLRFTF